MLLKPGVDISRLNREIRRALGKIKRACGEFVITSTYEGSHSPWSLHYANDAIDIRMTSWNGTPISTEILRAELGKDYDVVQESTHIHIEYDPKQ